MNYLENLYLRHYISYVNKLVTDYNPSTNHVGECGFHHVDFNRWFRLDYLITSVRFIKSNDTNPLSLDNYFKEIIMKELFDKTRWLILHPEVRRCSVKDKGYGHFVESHLLNGGTKTISLHKAIKEVELNRVLASDVRVYKNGKITSFSDVESLIHTELWLKDHPEVIKIVGLCKSKNHKNDLIKVLLCTGKESFRSLTKEVLLKYGRN